MTNAHQRIELFDALPQLSVRAASLFGQVAADAVAANDRFTVVLCGGSTPGRLYSVLAGRPEFRDHLPWDRTHFFWGDERHVPPEHAESNFRLANDAMLSKLKLPPGHVHRIRSEMSDATEAARAYEEELRAFCGLASSEVPVFDLVLLGMGADGHTASLFPGTAPVRETARLVVGHFVPQVGAFRITLTPPVLNAAAEIVFLVSGAEKANALAQVLEGPRDIDRLPAQAIHPARGTLTWLLDRAAASKLAR